MKAKALPARLTAAQKDERRRSLSPKQRQLEDDRWCLQVNNQIRRDYGLPKRTLAEWRAAKAVAR